MKQIVLIPMLFMCLLGCAQKSQPKQAATKTDYSKQAVKCLEEAKVGNSAIESQNKDKYDLIRDAQSRLLTSKEMSQLLGFDYMIFVPYPESYCDETGQLWGTPGQSYNEEDLYKKFLDLLYQQARFRALENKP